MRKTSNSTEEDYGECNRFKGVINFPNVYCVRFANVLCRNKKMVEKYKNEYYNPELKEYEVINSLQQLKSDLRKQRTNISVYEDKIRECIDTGNCGLLRSVLQDLFLEPLTIEQTEKIFGMIHNGLNECDVMKWYFLDKKILSLITFSVEYIKGK